MVPEGSVNSPPHKAYGAEQRRETEVRMQTGRQRMIKL